MTTWDDKPNDYEHALAEIERLKIKETDWELEVMYRGRPLSDYANHIREQCARAAERAIPGHWASQSCAAAIRALTVAPGDETEPSTSCAKPTSV